MENRERTVPPRTHIPYGPLGLLEVIVGRQIKIVGYRPGAQRETTVVDYAGNAWEVDLGPVADVSVTHVYRPQHVRGFPENSGWRVVGTEGSTAACPMDGAARYLGTQKQATDWAKRLNKRFMVDTSESTID